IMEEKLITVVSGFPEFYDPSLFPRLRRVASNHRPWRYSQIMGFLNPFLEDRATSTPSPTPTPTPTPNHLMGAIQAAAQLQPPDPDRQFFEGLLPDLKALSERKKAEVKFQIHRIIHEATCERLDGEE
uniref:BESS domain-containing protein n=1 Tax=Myripristis murdjan TaxID=586833 RepID=A0A667Y628_9TELE